jgi:hypothetical protein
MKLPDDFVYSQSSLQDYIDCRRRFHLRYVQHLAWPAAVTEPEAERERFLRLGNSFHRMIQQHILGIPEGILGAQASGDLARWWGNYLHYPIADLPDLRRAEVMVSAPLSGQRIEAKFDLLAIDPGERVVIVDWKTSRRHPAPQFLADRLQSKVYPFLLAQTAPDVGFGDRILPEQIEMIYWFADFPREPHRFDYTESQYQADEQTLIGLVEEIGRLEENEFERTTEAARCTYCPYRSLCRRGTSAGDYQAWNEDAEVDVALDFDFDQIAEIEF